MQEVTGHRRRIFAISFPLAVGLLIVSWSSFAQGGQAGPPAPGPAPVSHLEVKHDTSPPLSTIPPKAHKGRKNHVEHEIPVPAGSGTADPVVQTAAPKMAAPTVGQSFDGIPVQDSLPPDTNGAAGPNAFVQIVNEEFQVFSKTGASLYGPVPTNTLWTGFGTGCETNNDGDATVAYDRLADRWIIQQFSISTTPYLECIAVSATGDPTGSYRRYAFGDFNGKLPDYPKLAVWPDAYYVTYNLFGSAPSYPFLGPEVCAYDRAQMLLGNTATQQCKAISTLGGLLPSDVDSLTPPPAGSPNYVMGFDTGVLDLWKFHVDWTNSANSTFIGPTAIPVAAFNLACNGGACVPQRNTSRKLDSLGDRLMYRLAYRNFGDHESLVVSHSVKAGSTVGVRWYELRDPNGTPTVYQQGTYAPADSKYRWMGSAAMDGSGDIALGFSISSGSMFPGISYTGRLAGDPLGTMTQGETVLKSGGGSQTSYTRWGDYSSMSIDPSDDCTFWYTNEYLPSNGNFNWRTKIGSFKFPSCGTSSTGPPTVSTGAATSVGAASATLNGSANPNGLATSGYFRYATTNPGTCNNSFGTATSPTNSLGSGTSPQGYAFALPGLSASTTYYYCAVATNSAGTTAASNAPVSFTTSGSAAPSLTATPSSVAPGGNVTVSWSNVSGPTRFDWIALYHPGDPNTSYVNWIYDNSCTKTAGAGSLSSGSCSFTMPSTSGTYQFRLLPNDGWTTVATSNSVTVGAASASLSASPSSVAKGAVVTVTWSNIASPTRLDWIALYHPGDPNTAYVNWIYDNSCTKTAGAGSLSSGSCSFTMPSTSGTYQFRLLPNDGWTTVATSNSVTVN